MDGGRFLGKTVLVTGGNSGIGLAAARGFAAEGARVIIAGRDAATLASARAELGADTTSFQADLSTKGAVDELAASVAGVTDHLDVAFINAGIAAFAPLAAVDEASWDQIMNVNLKGSFFLSQALLPLLKPGSALVLCGSVGGRKAKPMAGLYGTSKAALAYLTRAMASEFCERGIRVNEVVPGPIDTPLPSRTGGVTPETLDHVKQVMIAATPMGRFGTPEECAAAVLFLASSAASFITGTSIMVDGGIVGCT